MKKNNQFNGVIANILVAVILFQCTQTHARFPHYRGGGQGYEPAGLDPNAHEFLAYQNAARSVVGVAPFRWSAELANFAQSYAEQRRSDCALIHSDGPLGENLFWGGGYGWSPAQAVKAWVDEGQYYDHSSNSCAPGQECGHYTQIVSAITTSVGCAMLQCDGDLGEFIICNYAPAGNYIGEKPY
ncbi:hypothetical protein MKW98_014030 [Papaver atlanticum]|uniref:SCP domain-containing protein n=1 Tax=Papaver atlanticum TaxID=357466 RepID=A0AAD4SJS4_9MAGN|nr:hypothetical protein MKW98_014030 [Papaver atlanticum]